MVFRFRSVSSMVIPAAKTGSESRSRTAVIRTDHTNKGVWYCDRAGGFMLMAVVMKLIAPKIEDTPARWREKIARSTEAPAWARLPARVGRQFTLFLLLLLLWMKLIGEGRMGVVVRSLCYLYVGMPCRVHRL